MDKAFTTNPQARSLAANLREELDPASLRLAFSPELLSSFNQRATLPAPQPDSSPAPQPPAAVQPVLPPPPADNPFTDLPFPSAGDRIKSDDFKKLSQSLRILYDMSLLAGTLFGRPFSEARLTLVGQNYEIARVMSVFGAEIDTLTDTSLDNRKVLQVAPVALGERLVTVVVTEAVDTRRFAPNLIGLTYRDGMDRLRALLGDAAAAGPPQNAEQLVGLTLGQARDKLSG